MGRNRKKAYQKLPNYVYVERLRVVYKPPGGGRITLGRLDDLSIGDIWKAVERLEGRDTDTLDYIAREYYSGDHFANLASAKERKRTLDALLNTETRLGRFGSHYYADVTPGVIRRYLDYKGNVAANREIAALSAAWSWCYERDIVKVANPCKGVKRLTEKPRQRLVTPDEYMTVFEAAPGYVRVAMELAYLCRLRLSEALDVRVRDMTDDGLEVRRLKGSKDALTLWSDRLRAACELGLQGRLRVPDMTIVADRHGQPVRIETFKSAWQRLQTKGLTDRFTFHDLKAMGVSYFEGNKQDAGGWSDARMVKIYDRMKIRVEPTE